ncbi:hypothetical protein JCM3765_007304 [Sporobolomyces pararoseus]
MINTYWKAFKAINQYKDPLLIQACTNLSGFIVDGWASMLLQEQWCAIAIFKTLSNLLADIKSQGLISSQLFHLWAPNEEQVRDTLAAVNQEVLAEVFGQHPETSHSPRGLHHTVSDQPTARYSQVLPNNTTHDSHYSQQSSHFQQRELSHRHPQLNHRMRKMYEFE